MQKYVFVFLFVHTLALSKEFSYNLRESCRSRISGYLLSLHDKTQIKAQAIHTLDEQNKKFSQVLRDIQAELHTLEVGLDKNSYDIKNTNRHKDLEYQKSSMEEIIKQNDLMIKKEQESLISFKEQKEFFLKKFSFVIKEFKIQKKEGLGYTFFYDFEEKCTEFQISCPLSKPKALKFLTELKSLKEDDFEICQRFALFEP
jgi:hypothetical protein